MLAAALFFVILFRRLRLGATLGYIVAGALIGPHALRLIPDPQQLLSITEIGIALLLFIVGLELQPSRLWRLRKDIFGLGLAQVVLCGAVISLLVGFINDLPMRVAVAIGLPLALSSTAQVLPLLRSDGELHTPQGERAFSILLFQDLSIIPLITIIAALAVRPDPDAPAGLTLALYTVGAIVGLIIVGRLLLNPMFRLIGRFGERELFVVAGLFTVVGASAVMHSLHLSVALGAFVAGVMLAESPYRHELESDVEPFRSILLGLFFLSVGMLLDLGLVAQRPWFVLGVAALVIVTKASVIASLARVFGNSWPRSVRLGLLLSQAGEFGFVLFTQATAASLITTEAASLFTAVVTFSMATTPFLMRLTDWLERIEERGGEGLDGPEASPETNAIVVGYGRFGQTVAQMLMAKRIPVTIVDQDAEQIEVSEEFGTKVYYGDGTRIDLLRTAGAERAEAILFCQDGDALTRDKLEAVLEAFPQAIVMVRVFDRRQVMDFAGLDVALLQREVFESAISMAREALMKLGVAEREADRVIVEYRVRDEERLQAQAQSGDLRAARGRMFAVDRPLPDEQQAAATPDDPGTSPSPR
ncbi:sodium:proton exchanger [Sphingomonas sinipercae]|uniref:Sodium:proton exchanger n=1 Tax=Sphingomonas sinipercae TaxID=2714944 RepID=A0A6G7ZR30_9SPHN|nr:cation:proton antiporter [Sphingomonas sinipercae]QIL03372.1 sodium:proton exchanger [Sphingomonas sinipercae]